MDRQALRAQLEDLIGLLDIQIEEVGLMARVSNVAPERLRDMNGQFLMVPLLIAKTTAMSALVHLY